MKKIFTLSAFLFVLLFFLSNFKSVTHNNGQFIFMALEEEPQLPSEPFAYSDIQLPEHFSRDTFDFGYGSNDVDSTRFDFIDDDVATLGRVLFYDKKLSALENISCASCHDQQFSFADNKAFSDGVNSPTKRNSMQLNDIGWTDNHSFFWDMSETDLREMIQLPLKDENEIGADMDEVITKLKATSYYPDLFEKAFGPPIINEVMIVEALAHFMSSMTTFNSKFDKASDEGLEDVFTEQEMHGMFLFGFSCGECHIQGDLSSLFGIQPEDEINMMEINPFMFTNGLPVLPSEDDIGAGAWFEGFDRLFKVPTLRNIELTGPYMHDGRFETLEEVVQYYSQDVEVNDWQWIIPEGGYGFSEEEQQALVAFLKTLTDYTFIEDEKFSDPFGVTSIKPTPEAISNLVVRPNPMGDFSIIEFDAEPNDRTQLRITNGQGQEVLRDIINGNSYQLNKANFGTGVYFLNFQQGNKTSTHKLIVQ